MADSQRPEPRFGPEDTAHGIAPWSSPYRLPEPTGPAASVLAGKTPAAAMPAPAPTPHPTRRRSFVRAPSPAIVPPAPPRRVIRWTHRAALGVLIAALPIAGTAFVSLPGRVAPPPPITAVFTAPALVLRAAVAGRIVSVDAIAGASVQPDTPLLTIRATPPPDPAADALQTRLDAAQARIAALDSQIAQPALPTKGAAAIETVRARQADNARLRAGAAAERNQLNQAIAGIRTKIPADLVVRAKLRGYVRSLEAEAGTAIVAGAPLAYLIDCGRAFLVPQEGAERLRAGDRVHAKMPGMPDFTSVVRAAAGISEPPGSLVIDPPREGAATSACPLGALAEIFAETPAS